MIPLHARRENFDGCMRGLKALANLDGLLVTIPYKNVVMNHIDVVLPAAKRIGAMNALRREADGTWSGDMFDGAGFLGGLRSSGLNPKGLSIMLIGAGGAGSAIADALAEAGARTITIFDRHEEKAEALAQNYSVPSEVRRPGRMRDTRRHRSPHQRLSNRHGARRWIAGSVGAVWQRDFRRRYHPALRTDAVARAREGTRLSNDGRAGHGGGTGRRDSAFLRSYLAVRDRLRSEHTSDRIARFGKSIFDRGLTAETSGNISAVHMASVSVLEPNRTSFER
jgi:hypothetical protein